MDGITSFRYMICRNDTFILFHDDTFYVEILIPETVAIHEFIKTIKMVNLDTSMIYDWRSRTHVGGVHGCSICKITLEDGIEGYKMHMVKVHQLKVNGVPNYNKNYIKSIEAKHTVLSAEYPLLFADERAAARWKSPQTKNRKN